jgi:hypothetical protein
LVLVGLGRVLDWCHASRVERAAGGELREPPFGRDGRIDPQLRGRADSSAVDARGPVARPARSARVWRGTPRGRVGRPDPPDRRGHPTADRHAVNAVAEGGRGRSAGPPHAGVPRAQTDRCAQGGRARPVACGARAEHVARPARRVGPEAARSGEAGGRPGVWGAECGA